MALERLLWACAQPVRPTPAAVQRGASVGPHIDSKVPNNLYSAHGRISPRATIAMAHALANGPRVCPRGGRLSLPTRKDWVKGWVNGLGKTKKKANRLSGWPAVLLVGRQGLEPWTLGLKVPCSAN